MRRRLIIAAAIAVVAMLIVVPIASAKMHPRPAVTISDPGIVGRQITAGQEFKVTGFVWPRQSEDTTRVAVVLVSRWVGGGHPRFSAVATAPATFGWPAGKAWSTYDASVTVASAGTYRLTAAILDDGAIIARSGFRQLVVKDPAPAKPLFVSKPGIIGRHIRAGKEFGVVGYVAPQLSSDTTMAPVIQVFKWVGGARPRYSQVDTVTASWAGTIGTRATSYEASVTIAAVGAYRLKAAVLDGDGKLVKSSEHRPLNVGDAPHGRD